MRKIIIINPSSKTSCLGASTNKPKPKQRSNTMARKRRKSSKRARAARRGWRRRKRTRSNPKRRRTYGTRRRKTNGRKRSYRRRTRRNPRLKMPSVRSMFGGPALTKSFSILTGFVGGFILPSMLIQQLPITDASTRMWADRLKGLAVVLLGSMVNMQGRRAITKDIGTGLVVSGFYDLLAMNVPQLPLPTVTPKPLSLTPSEPVTTTGAGFSPGEGADVIGAGISNYADADVIGEELELDDIV